MPDTPTPAGTEPLTRALSVAALTCAQPEPTEVAQRRFIVAIGAAAGGLSALSTQSSRLPVDLGLPRVILQHLSPTYRSMLAKVQRYTKMDFSGHKASTMWRRMATNRVVTLDDNIPLTPQNPDELSPLCKNLLISVTSFLRDAGSFVALRQAQAGGVQLLLGERSGLQSGGRSEAPSVSAGQV